MNPLSQRRHSHPHLTLTRAAVAAVLAGCALPALAQTQPSSAPSPAAQAPVPAYTPPPGAKVDSAKLLEMLVKSGVLTREQADQLVRESESAAAAPGAAPATAEPGVQIVPHIPEPVRQQMEQELRTEVMDKAEKEGWATPGAVAEWTRHVRFSGDVRVRSEGDFMDSSNYPDFVNFGAINSGSGYDVSAANDQNPPYLNTTKTRERERLRARFAVDADVDSWVRAELRVATGNDGSPISFNQTLGNDFSKYSLWIDRGYIRLTPGGNWRIDFGRSDNPFWTTDLLFWNDLDFDGFSVGYRGPDTNGFHVFGTAGAFPIFNTDLNFGSRSAGSFASTDKWLGAAQLGGKLVTNRVKLTLAGGYFNFGGVEGKLSAPCQYSQDVCNTDDTRPQFTQWGNTLFPIRQIVPNPSAPPGLSPDVQYFGLATGFRVLDVHGNLDFLPYGALHVQLDLDYVDNLAFDRARVAGRAVNNLGADNAGYKGGNRGWYGLLTVGKKSLDVPGDWNLSAGYRYIESDAVMDAFNDPDFHMGGTNAKGYTVMGGYAFAKKTSVNLKWTSSDVVSGAPYSVDIVMLDLNTRF
jgi:hypothetical protein